VFWNLYVFFWVFPRRQIKFCRRFGTLCQVHLQRLDEEYSLSDAGEILKRKHTSFRTRWKSEIKNRYCTARLLVSLYYVIVSFETILQGDTRWMLATINTICMHLRSPHHWLHEARSFGTWLPRGWTSVFSTSYNPPACSLNLTTYPLHAPYTRRVFFNKFWNIIPCMSMCRTCWCYNGARMRVFVSSLYLFYT
jgi:hypothetical protein